DYIEIIGRSAISWGDLNEHLILFAPVVETRHLPSAKQGLEGATDGKDARPRIRDPLAIKLNFDLRRVEDEVGVEIEDAGVFRDLRHHFIDVFLKPLVAFRGLDDEFNRLAARA